MKYAGKTTSRAAIAATLFGSLLFSAPLQLYAQDVEEIIVTARKKDESLQEVPLAVSVVTAGMVERLGLQDLDDIAKITAGLVFDAEFDRTSNRPVIRGQANILGDSGVASFIDGVYITGSINDYDINDVERVEVVKGPQSALYGRNTYSGAINIITKAPGDTWQGRGLMKFSDDGHQEVSASIKGPVSDSLGVGVTARYFQHDGAFTNTFDGSDIGEQESTSVSAVAVWEPSERFTARARVYVGETADGQTPLVAQPASENNCFPDNGSLYAGLGRYYCGEVRARPVNSDWTIQAPDSANDRDLLQASLSFDFELNARLTLNSVTGYNNADEVFTSEADYGPTSFQTAVFARFPLGPIPGSWGFVGSPVDFTFADRSNIEDISQELRLSWQGESSEFMIGAYYFVQRDDATGNRNLPPNGQALANASFGAAVGSQQAWCGSVPFLCTGIFPLFGPTVAVNRDQNNSDIRNMALFGMAAFDVGDNSKLTLEARWADEKKEQVLIAQDLGGSAGAPEYKVATFDSFSPRITFDHQLSDDHMVYALYAEGTKPGGFNSALAAAQGKPTFEEEEVKSIEVGSKNVALEGHLVANLSIFFNQVTGYQLTQNVRSGANTSSATVNAGDADIFGAEIEMRYAAQSVEGLATTFNYAFTDAQYVRGEDENLGLINDVADNGLIDCSTGSQFATGSCISKFGSIIGNQVPRTAEHQLYLDVEIRRPLGNGDWDWYAGANMSYESSKFAQVLNLAETGDTTLVGARVGFESDRYAVSLWGKNLTGEDSSPLVLRYADGNDSFKRNFVVMPRRDTYWGLTASANFE